MAEFIFHIISKILLGDPMIVLQFHYYSPQEPPHAATAPLNWAFMMPVSLIILYLFAPYVAETILASVHIQTHPTGHTAEQTCPSARRYPSFLAAARPTARKSRRRPGYQQAGIKRINSKICSAHTDFPARHQAFAWNWPYPASRRTHTNRRKS